MSFVRNKKASIQINHSKKIYDKLTRITAV